jgi:hypothetical protein
MRTVEDSDLAAPGGVRMDAPEEVMREFGGSGLLVYTVLLPLVAFAVFGSSRHLVVAADSATAAIFASSLSRMAEPASEHYMALVGMVALLTAGLLVLARIFKLGFLADFLSRTALVGFLTGVGVQVGTAMLGDMLGVNVASRRTLVQLWQVLQGLPSLCLPRSSARTPNSVRRTEAGRRTPENRGQDQYDEHDFARTPSSTTPAA